MNIKRGILESMIKRIGIVAKDGWNLQISTKQAKSGLFMQALCLAPDETVQTIVNMPLESGDPDFRKTIKSKEFIVIDGLATLSEGDVSIEPKGSKLRFSNDVSTMEIDMVASEVKGANADKKNSKYSIEINKDEFLDILKNAIRYTDNNAYPNIILHVKERSITVSGLNGNALCYARADCITLPGNKWDEACSAYEPLTTDEAPGCDTAVPAMFVSFLISALSLSSANSVSLIVDSKYLHLRYDNYSIISVRLSERILKVNNFWSVIESPPEECFAVEKLRFDAAVRLLRKRLDINKALAANVGIHLTVHEKALVVSVADNLVRVPIVECSGNPTYDMYVAPAYLDSAIAACKAGNILIKRIPGYEKSFICANGTVKDGFSSKVPHTLFMALNMETAQQSEARFASGIEVTKEEAKAQNK